jgi:ubiquinone/menaquinone biosynthesis C-methylase UbiE
MNVPSPDIYEPGEIAETFGSSSNHRSMHELILESSENKDDVREIALKEIDLSRSLEVLDIGCGFGFFISALENRIPDGATITGIDLCEDNSSSFLGICEKLKASGTFIANRIHRLDRFPEHSFNLILCSYALYFFPQVIPDIARILAPDGHFITITHSEDSFQELYQLMREESSRNSCEPLTEFYLERLIRNFSAENGEDLLSPHFQMIDRRDYPNRLCFPPERIDDCITYVRLKRKIFFKDIIQTCPTLENEIYQSFTSAPCRGNPFILTKDDTIFRCSRPKI